MKNILLLNYDAKIGGAEKVLITNCQILSEDNSIFVVLNKKGLLEKNIQLYSKQVYLFPVGNKITAFLRNKYFNRELEEIISKNNIDLIYINSLKSLLLYLPALKKRNDIILHLHDNITFSFFGFWTVILRHVLKKLSPKIIAISDYCCRFIPPGLKNVNVLYNTSPFGKEEKPEIKKYTGRQFLMVGRITPWKGQLEVLKIMKNFLLKDKKIKLSFVGGPLFGETNYYNKLTEFVRKNNLEENVTFYNQVEDENIVKDFYFNTDFVLHASIKPEPFGLVILEAMMSGSIIIASKYGAAPEIIRDGINGFIFDPLDLESAHKKISGILSMGEKEINSIRENAIATYWNNYSYPEYKRKLKNIFQMYGT